MHINERIKFIRNCKNLTQEEVAKQAKINITQYRKYELGINVPSVEKLKEICKALQISADYILGLPKGSWYPTIG